MKSCFLFVIVNFIYYVAFNYESKSLDFLRLSSHSFLKKHPDGLDDSAGFLLQYASLTDSNCVDLEDFSFFQKFIFDYLPHKFIIEALIHSSDPNLVFIGFALKFGDRSTPSVIFSFIEKNNLMCSGFDKSIIPGDEISIFPRNEFLGFGLPLFPQLPGVLDYRLVEKLDSRFLIF